MGLSGGAGDHAMVALRQELLDSFIRGRRRPQTHPLSSKLRIRLTRFDGQGETARSAPGSP